MKLALAIVLSFAAATPVVLGPALALACPTEEEAGHAAESDCDHCLSCFQTHGHGQLVTASSAALGAHRVAGAPEAAALATLADPFAAPIDHPPLR